MTIAVRPASSRRRPSSIAPSVCRSTFEVASSRTRIRGSAIERAGERDELALAGRELHAALADLGVEPVRQRADEVPRADRAAAASIVVGASRPGARRRCCRATVPLNRKRLLGHDPHLRAQRRRRAPSRRSWPSTSTRPLGRVVEARDELGERRLAGAGRAHERDGLARRHGRASRRSSATSAPSSPPP